MKPGFEFHVSRFTLLRFTAQHKHLFRATALALVLWVAPAAWTQTTTQKPSPKPTTQKPTGAKTNKAGTGGPSAAWKQIPIPPLAPFHPQEPRRIQLANGMVIFLQEDHELPVVGGTMRIRGGSIQEPAEKVGLVESYGAVWRTGGTAKRTGDELDDFLETRAAKVETGGGADSTTISFDCLKDKLDEVFPVFLEVLREPAFRPDKLELAKTQMNTDIARRNDDVGEIAGRESVRLAYGRDNPYARIPEYSTVAAITRDDLVKWHATFVHPNNIILGIFGDFDPAAMERRLHEAFDSWPQAPVPPKREIQFHDPKPGLYYIEKTDVTQSEIRMVTLGIQRNNPDYFSLEVMNEVLGGGFASRLFKTIRTEKGLAYSVGGGIGSAFSHPGIARIAMGTKSPTTVDAIQALYAELNGIRTDRPITAEEVREAKDSILNRFIFHFDSKDKVLGERMLYEFHGYPADFLERYHAGIEQTTPAEANRVAQKYIHPQQFAVLVVGNQAEFAKPLSSLGPVTAIDISIPAPGAPANAGPSTPSQSDPKARDLVEKFVTSIGGATKLEGVKAVHQKLVSTQQSPQGAITFNNDLTIEFPDKLRAAVTAEQMPGEMVIVVSPSSSFMTMPGAGTHDMPSSLKEDRLNNLKREWLAIAQHAGDPAYVFTLGGTVKIGNTEAQEVNVWGNGIAVKWALEPQSARLLRVSYHDVGQRGPVERVISYSDWRAVDGIKVPFQRTITENGQPSANEQIETYQVNPGVNAKLFEKPPETPPK
ncbi:MAG: M16 family metallopeptidase [Terriglobales bacterium]